MLAKFGEKFLRWVITIRKVLPSKSIKSQLFNALSIVLISLLVAEISYFESQNLLSHSLSQSVFIYDIWEQLQLLAHATFLVELVTVFLHARKLFDRSTNTYWIVNTTFHILWVWRVIWTPCLAGVVFQIFATEPTWYWIMVTLALLGLEGLYIYWSYELYILKRQTGRDAEHGSDKACTPSPSQEKEEESQEL